MNKRFGCFFLPNQLKFFHVASDSTEKHCPAFFLPVLAYFNCKKRCMPKMLWPFFVKTGNKKNLLSSLFSKISGARDYSYRNTPQHKNMLSSLEQIGLQSTLSKTETFGTSTSCPS